ncbi:hypothetical protein ACFLX7_03450 [Chloroflexota bacterium]
MMLGSGCVHWWIIGGYSVGHCKKCGATRDFEKLRQAEKTRLTARKGKKGNAADNALKL